MATNATAHFAKLLVDDTYQLLSTSEELKALESLKKRLAIRAKVLRNGEWVIRDAREIVPGDVIEIGLGDLVAADAKIVAGEVSVDQSALTGGSLPVTTHQVVILYSSSIVKRGEVKAVILNTGANTYFGKTAELVKIAKPKSHQQIMSAIVKYAMYCGIAALGFVRNWRISRQNRRERITSCSYST